MHLAFTTGGEGEDKRFGFLLFKDLPKYDTDVWDAVFRELGVLEDLNYLQITRCPMPKVPESLGTLAKLRVLVFRENEIEQLPGSLENLSCLEMFRERVEAGIL